MHFDPPVHSYMRSRFFIVLAGIAAGVCMGVGDPAKAQQISNDAASESSFPTIGSSTTNAASATPPPAPPPIPSQNAPISSLFTPVTPAYGSGGVSETGEALAESMKQSSANQPYNLRVGPVLLRAEADVGVSVNDNIGLTRDDRVTDIITSPTGILHGKWIVSDLNTLTFNVGVGYQAYLLNSQYDSVTVSPDSEVNFNLFIGDCTVNFHDNFSYEQDPTQVGQLSNQVRLSRFSNDAGITATWDLDEILVSASYDHNNFWVLQSVYDYLTNQSDTFSPQITWKVNESISTGLSASFTDTRYQQSFQSDNTNETIGPFVSASLSKFLSVSASGGGYFTQYSGGSGNGDTTSELASYYLSFGLNHQITQYISQSLTGGKQYLPGLTSNYTERIYANYSVQWAATKEINFNASAFWESLNDSAAAFSEDSDRYGLSFAASDALTDKLNVNLGYQFILKQATPSIESYLQNVGTLGLQYNF
jgi:hypothetical protein